MRSVCFLIIAFSLALPVSAQDASPGSPIVASLLRLPAKTLGGDQFWADEFVQSGWRIQKNVFSGHYRLLDDNDYRRALGDYETCRARFEALRPVESASQKTKAVVLLHGLGRSRDTMAPLGEYLAQHGDYEIVNVSYPSTRAEVGEHAASLAKVLENLKGIEEVSFVGHSMGNIVVRHWMHEHYKPETSPFKIGRFVMLGPPNNGAQLAKSFQRNHLFGLLTGPSGKQLGEAWVELSETLCTPSCEFGIVAGMAAVPNPLVPGSDDLLVSVEETKLPGAADFRVLTTHHAGVRTVGKVGDLVLSFLQNGRFGEEHERIRLR